MVQTDLGKKQNPISKITRAKRAGGVAQVVAHLPKKYKAKFKPSTAPQKKWWVRTSHVVRRPDLETRCHKTTTKTPEPTDSGCPGKDGVTDAGGWVLQKVPGKR
jgi:hypothetical protein